MTAVTNMTQTTMTIKSIMKSVILSLFIAFYHVLVIAGHCMPMISIINIIVTAVTMQATMKAGK